MTYLYLQKNHVGILIEITLNLYVNNQLTHNYFPITEILMKTELLFRQDKNLYRIWIISVLTIL